MKSQKTTNQGRNDTTLWCHNTTPQSSSDLASTIYFDFLLLLWDCDGTMSKGTVKPAVPMDILLQWVTFLRRSMAALVLQVSGQNGKHCVRPQWVCWTGRISSRSHNCLAKLSSLGSNPDSAIKSHRSVSQEGWFINVRAVPQMDVKSPQTLNYWPSHLGTASHNSVTGDTTHCLFVKHQSDRW